MTPLKKPVSRKTEDVLGGEYGPDSGRALVVTLTPAHGSTDAMIAIRPLGTRRAELIAVKDVYRIALMGRVNRELLVRAREMKARKAEARAAAARERAEAKLRREARRDREAQ